jgi:hypothetical protein
LHQILNEDPRPLRQLDRSIPIELETIVLKALAKSPTDRYTRAGELAADLRRFLDERPILARRPSLVERGRKWMRRHPSLVGAGVLLLVFGMIGLAVTTALVAREQTLTQAALKQERQRAKEAEVRFELARRAADDMIQIAEEELADKPFQEGLRKRLLETALTYYQELIEQRGDDANAQAELAATGDRVKKILGDLAVLQGAGQIFLLKHSAMLDDLEVSDEQRVRLADLTKRLDEQRPNSFREFHKMPSEERRKRFLEEARTNEADLAAILTPDQLRRLRQVELQRQGPMAFREADVAKALKLTADQRERIRAIEATAFFGRGDRPGHGPPPRGVREQAIKSAMEKVHAVLTDEQAKKWKEMIGEPFKGVLTALPHCPPGPHGPPGPFGLHDHGPGRRP